MRRFHLHHPFYRPRINGTGAFDIAGATELMEQMIRPQPVPDEFETQPSALIELDRNRTGEVVLQANVEINPSVAEA